MGKSRKPAGQGGDVTSSESAPEKAGNEFETAIDPGVASCGGELRATIRALVLANDFPERQVAELKKAVSRAFARGRFET